MSGCGRGRGWLKLHINEEIKPGICIGEQETIINGFFSPEDKMPLELNFSEKEIEKLISAIDCLDKEDDGIKLNQKIDYIKETYLAVCKNDEHVRKAFDGIFDYAMKNDNFLQKFILLTTTRTFESMSFHSISLKTVLIGKFQDNYENAHTIREKDINELYNSINILSCFFNKTSLPYGIFAVALAHYFRLLLEYAEPADIQIFFRQLCLTGEKILSQNLYPEPKEVMKMVDTKIRSLLQTESSLSENCRLYLLLSIDLINNNCTKMPLHLLNYYQTKMDDKAFLDFSKSFSELTISIEPNHALDSYKSSVNILLLDMPKAQHPTDNPTSHDFFEDTQKSQKKVDTSTQYSSDEIQISQQRVDNKPSSSVGTQESQKSVDNDKFNGCSTQDQQLQTSITKSESTIDIDSNAKNSISSSFVGVSTIEINQALKKMPSINDRLNLHRKDSSSIGAASTPVNNAFNESFNKKYSDSKQGPGAHKQMSGNVRPILGAGARPGNNNGNNMNQRNSSGNKNGHNKSNNNRGNDQKKDNWKQKDRDGQGGPASHERNQQRKKDWAPSKTKWYEHDNRFDKDYS